MDLQNGPNATGAQTAGRFVSIRSRAWTVLAITAPRRDIYPAAVLVPLLDEPNAVAPTTISIGIRAGQGVTFVA